MDRLDRVALDRHITGNYGEDSVPQEETEQAENFDRAFGKEDDPTMALLKRVLSSFDLDIYAEGSHFTGVRYTARLWEEGNQVCECGPGELESVLQDIDRNAGAIVSAYNM